MKELEKIIKTSMKQQNFDSIAVGIINFENNNFFVVDLGCPKGMFFDLASLTKPLSLASTYHRYPNLFTNDMLLLLNHRAGLPSWGRLGANEWKRTVLRYQVEESEELYSDFSAMRLMLEIEAAGQRPLISIISEYLDKEVVYWKSLPSHAICPFTGIRKGDIICGEVHDDNAFYINEFTAHAGLFSTIDGVCKTLITLNRDTSFVSFMSNQLPVDRRFCNGWDTVSNPSNTLAGVGCSSKTFGHLGFTGTSLWIDPEKNIGHVILANATQNYWYERDGLSELRRAIGQWIWNNYKKFKEL